MSEAPLRILIVEARFYDHLADFLLAGAKAALEAGGAAVEVVTVPGALEIPGVIAAAADTRRFDGYVALGTVIRGETYHFEVVSNESCRGIMDLTGEPGGEPQKVGVAWIDIFTGLYGVIGIQAALAERERRPRRLLRPAPAPPSPPRGCARPAPPGRPRPVRSEGAHV